MAKHPFEEWWESFDSKTASEPHNDCCDESETAEEAWNAALGALATKKIGGLTGLPQAIDELTCPGPKPEPQTLREAAQALADNAWGLTETVNLSTHRIETEKLNALREALEREKAE